MKITFGPLDRADGSCQVQMDDGTSVVCSVDGPMECTKRSNERMDRCFIDVHFHPLATTPGPHEKRSELLLQSLAEAMVLVKRYPRSSLLITVQQLDHGVVAEGTAKAAFMDARWSNGVACAVNAMYLALVHAGVALTQQVAAMPFVDARLSHHYVLVTGQRTACDAVTPSQDAEVTPSDAAQEPMDWLQPQEEQSAVVLALVGEGAVDLATALPSWMDACREQCWQPMRQALVNQWLPQAPGR